MVPFLLSQNLKKQNKKAITKLSIAAFMIGLRVEIMAMSIIKISVAFRIAGPLLQNIISGHNWQ